jgi:hypothetical protein
MKKAKLLIATLVCTVMLMGVGYAWWTDSVVIGGTAATGNMDVHFENGIILPLVMGSEYVKPTRITVEARKITCEFDKLYPGAVGNIDFLVKNDSTIPVKLDKAKITVNGNDNLISNLKAFAVFYKINQSGFPIISSFGWTEIVSLKQLDEALNRSKLKDITLYPGERIFFGVPEGQEGPYDLDGDGEKESCIVLWVDPQAPNTTQNQSANFTLTMDWKQFNQQ